MCESAAQISRSAPRSHASQTRSRRTRRTIPCAAHRVCAHKASNHPHPLRQSRTRSIGRSPERMLPPQPCVRSDRRIDQTPPVSKEAGDFEQGVDQSNNVHRASRMAALSALAHLSHHLSCPRSLENLRPRMRSGWHGHASRDGVMPAGPAWCKCVTVSRSHTLRATLRRPLPPVTSAAPPSASCPRLNPPPAPSTAPPRSSRPRHGLRALGPPRRQHHRRHHHWRPHRPCTLALPPCHRRPGV